MYLAVTVARVIVGVILSIAGIAKLIDPRAFERAVRSYDLLPPAVSSIAAKLLPIAEVITGALLLANVELRWSAGMAVLLFLVFGTAIAVNIRRGRTDIGCGCCGGMRGRLTWTLVWRNAALAFLSMIAAAAAAAP